MSTISDAFTGGNSAASGSNATSQLFSDATLGSELTTGSDLFSPDATGGSFNSFNSIVNALSGGGGSPNAVQAAATSPAAAAATGGDPTGAAGGTQSSTSPGQTTPQQQNQQEQQTAPKASDEQGRAAAVPKLQDLIAALKGQPPGPTWILPQVKPGETGPQSSTSLINAPLRMFPGGQPGLTPGETGPQSPMQTSTDVLRKAAAALAGSQPGEARTPPPGADTPTPEGRQIAVRAKAIPPDPTIMAGGPGHGAAVAPPATAPQPETVGPPTQLGPQPAPPAAATPQQAQPAQMSRLMRDIAGISTGNPMALADLAMALYGIGAPLAIAMGSKGGRPSMRPGGHPGVDYAGGYGEAQNLLKEEDDRGATLAGLRFNKHGQPAPAGPFDRNGAFVGSAEKTPTSNQIPGVNAKMADDYIRQAAQKRGIDPNVASRFLGAESGYGQNNLGDKDAQGNWTSFGPLQLHFAPGGKAMGDQFLRDTGLNPRDFAHNWRQQIDYGLDKAAKGGWGPWQTSMGKLHLSQWSGINRQSPPISLRPEGTNPGVSFLTSGVG